MLKMMIFNYCESIGIKNVINKYKNVKLWQKYFDLYQKKAEYLSENSIKISSALLAQLVAMSSPSQNARGSGARGVAEENFFLKF